MHIGEIQRSRQLPNAPIGDKNLTPIAQLPIGGDQLTKDQVLACDMALSDYSDLISPAWKAWHCKAWYTIGRERYAVLASQARSDGAAKIGGNPAKLMSYLLRKELKLHAKAKF